MSHPLYDVAIIGAGVTGSAIARHLSRFDLKLILIDAEADVAMGASRANSAIVHAGYDCEPGTMMARMNVRGNALYDSWCAELDVPLKRIGSLVIGFGPEDEAELKKLYERGLSNGVPGMRLISGDEARAMEPSLSQDVTLALHAATGAITCPYEMTIACAENARDNGCEWLLNAPVSAIVPNEGGLTITAGGRDIEARYVINAAGLYADEIARMVGDDSFAITPRKGEYLLLDRTAQPLHTVIFQTPSALGKGVLVSPTVDGNCFAGPTAVDQTDKTDTSVRQEGIDELMRQARRSTPDIDFRKVITAFAGLRAQPKVHDFILRASGACPRMLLAAGICSPGLTSAPAIAEYMAQLLCEAGLALNEKPDFNPNRRHIPAFRHMTDEQRAEIIAENPLYGRIICRCETITEGEIVEAIRRGATTVDGVKRRTRAGMGRCQGGFCGPRVMDILARELNLPMEEITKFGRESHMIVGRTR